MIQVTTGVYYELAWYWSKRTWWLIGKVGRAYAVGHLTSIFWFWFNSILIDSFLRTCDDSVVCVIVVVQKIHQHRLFDKFQRSANHFFLSFFGTYWSILPFDKKSNHFWNFVKVWQISRKVWLIFIIILSLNKVIIPFVTYNIYLRS